MQRGEVRRYRFAKPDKKRPVVVNADHLQTVARGRIGPLITRLSDAKMEELRRALLFAFGYRA